jgi:hypothetical protein
MQNVAGLLRVLGSSDHFPAQISFIDRRVQQEPEMKVELVFSQAAGHRGRFLKQSHPYEKKKKKNACVSTY